MSKKDLNIKIDELASTLGTFKGLEISIGRIVDEEWEEPMGPTPFPHVGTLRSWDRKLLEKYKPFYMPFCDLCCLCTYGV
jgi:acetyl-CoA decarbonylase/synthase complex subunit alpha